MNRAGSSLWMPLCVAIAAAACLSTQAAAASLERVDRPLSFDQRYGHNRSYPPRGHVVPALPRDVYTSRLHGTTYYFHGGVWYRQARSHWVVIAPPLGLVVPFLPPFYTTIWIGGAPYYYANDVYYSWRPSVPGYVVVEPPAQEAAVDSGAVPSDLYVYPKNGQSAQQQATDRYECHRWSAGETQFDPTQPSGGVAPSQTAEKRAAYFRAMTACLEGRGYSVK